MNNTKQHSSQNTQNILTQVLKTINSEEQRYLYQYGLKTAQDIFNFLKSHDGKIIQSLILKELIKDEDIKKERAFEYQQQILAKHYKLAFLFMAMIQREKAAHADRQTHHASSVKPIKKPEITEILLFEDAKKQLSQSISEVQQALEIKQKELRTIELEKIHRFEQLNQASQQLSKTLDQKSLTGLLSDLNNLKTGPNIAMHHAKAIDKLSKIAVAVVHGDGTGVNQEHRKRKLIADNGLSVDNMQQASHVLNYRQKLRICVIEGKAYTLVVPSHLSDEVRLTDKQIKKYMKAAYRAEINCKQLFKNIEQGFVDCYAEAIEKVKTRIDSLENELEQKKAALHDLLKPNNTHDLKTKLTLLKDNPQEEQMTEVASINPFKNKLTPY